MCLSSVLSGRPLRDHREVERAYRTEHLLRLQRVFVSIRLPIRMDNESRRRILFAGGTVSVAVGTYLPWLGTDPDLSPDAKTPTIHCLGRSVGLEGFDFALLGAVGLVLLLHRVDLRTEIRTATTVAVGLGVTAFPAYYLSHSALVGFSGTFVPAPGLPYRPWRSAVHRRRRPPTAVRDSTAKGDRKPEGLVPLYLAFAVDDDRPIGSPSVRIATRSAQSYGRHRSRGARVKITDSAGA